VFLSTSPNYWSLVLENERHGLIASGAREEENPLMVFEANPHQGLSPRGVRSYETHHQACLVSAFSFLSISGASAQAIARAEIPFDFSCQRQAMPRGEYTISILQERIIQFSSKGWKDSRGQSVGTER
jgi:hypothetical protein